MTTPAPLPTEQEQAAARLEAERTAELRALVSEILKPALSFEPATIRKAIVTAISAATTPPTISVQMSGDTTTTVSGVRIEEDYSPRVGHTVLIFKQGNDIFAFGHIADLAGAASGGWTTAGLASGWTHNGNSGGDVQYRKVMQDGSWKMQWRGCVGTGSGTSVLASALAAEFCPASKRPVITGRDPAGGAVACQLDFNTSGTITVVGGTQTADSASVSGNTGSTSTEGSVSSGGGFSVGSHGHYIDFDGNGGIAGHNHFGGNSGGGFSVGSHGHSFNGDSHNHSFSGGSHSHSVNGPSWVGFNVEYFL